MKCHVYSAILRACEVLNANNVAEMHGM